MTDELVEAVDGALIVIDKSAWGMIVVVSLTLRLFICGSIGVVREAELLSVPVAVGITVALTIIDAEAPGFKFNETFTFPL